MELIQVIIIIFALFALSRAMLRFRDNKLGRNEFLFWAGLWTAAIIISFIPSILGVFSGRIGTTSGLDLVLYLSIIALFYLMFRLYVRTEALEKEITSVVRELAINPEKKKRQKKKK